MATLTPHELPATAIPMPMQSIRAFCKKWHIEEFSLFGSVLRADFRADSDVDVMVVFEPDARVTFIDIFGMEDELAALFGRSVDLTTRKAVERMTNSIRRKDILKSARIIHAN